ncbi:hypothetical protein SBA4_1190002 [Candidatus Sulfopaludibacter sp. SbA4]|nr:hypothetical protein SBA4_1190002 [Candidatus Sulfopaludibacter sp. SbA4]
MTRGKPRILIAGAGRFGRQHLKEWKLLAAEGRAELAAIVVASAESRRRVEREWSVPAYTGFTAAMLEEVDGVDLVTPSATHYSLAKQCLSCTNLLVEKPLAMNAIQARELEADARRNSRILMVNHLFRCDPVVLRLKELLGSSPERPQLIQGSFLQEAPAADENLVASFEMLHYFDVIEHLFGEPPAAVLSEQRGGCSQVSLRYPGGMNAVLYLGWHEGEKVRSLVFEYAGRKVEANFLDRTIFVRERDSMERILVDRSVGPLRAALQTFLGAIQGEPVQYPNGELGARIVEIAERALPGPRRVKPRVAVIGGGIFGAACALEFAPHADVTLFERHPDFMMEASFQNQWRFHSGFHYPRSPQTVQEIQSTREDFCSEFGEAVIDDVVSYYCTSNQAVEITRERYLAICTQNKLSFVIEDTPPRYVDSSRVNLCLRTDESVFDFYKLREMAKARLREHPNVVTLLNTEVAHGEIDHYGRKILTSRGPDSSRRDEFEYLVNTTYANSNIIARWFNFPVRRLRFDFCEMAVLEIPMPNVSLTVLDGPFCSLVSTGHNRTFILTHIHESVLKSRITADGLPPAWGEIQSNRSNLIQSCARYFPIVKDARFVESRYGVRTVEAFTEDYDGRPTVVTDHGLGCWSVLGGKIGTCVSNAREIVDRVFPGADRELGRCRGMAVTRQ